jgi:transposase
VDDQRGHLDRAGAPARGGRSEKGGTSGIGGAKATVAAQDGEAIGRSRGGLTTKIHLAVDGRGRPLSILLTPGQAGDNPHLLPLLNAIRVKAPGPGRPRKRPEMLIADKGYAHDPTRRELRRRRIRHTIPERRDQLARRTAKGNAGGRPPDFDRHVYQQRNVVERCFNRLKQNRALATRYAKRAAYYRALLVLATVILWLREDPQDRP